MPRRQHGRVVVAAHDPERHKDRKQGHQQRLGRQQNHYRQGQRRQIPELERHQRNREEQRQADIAQQRHFTLKHLMPAKRRQAVAQHHAHKQHAYKRRQFESRTFNKAIQEGADLQADRQ